MERITLSALVLLATSFSVEPAQSQTDESSSYLDTSLPLVFHDSDSFDKVLSEHLKENPDEIRIEFADVSIKALPDRLDKWLSVIENSRGVVEMEATGNQVVGGFEVEEIHLNHTADTFGSSQIMYKPVQHYNALVGYTPSDGRVAHIILKAK